MTILLGCALALPWLRAESPAVYNLDRKGVAVQGYDPVAFFALGKPVKGDPAIKTTLGAATYYF